jgi:hypothetical protein
VAAEGWSWLGATGPSVAALVVLLHLGQAAMLISTAVALRRAGRTELLGWSLTLPLYWPLATLSAFKGLAEMALAPTWWDKTSHGAPEDAAPAGSPSARPRRRALRSAPPLAAGFRAPVGARSGAGGR